MPDNTEAVLGTLCLGTRPPPKGLSPKLASIAEEKLPESFYLLAAYCFDAQRKLLYLSKVARPFAAAIPPDLARQIQLDTERINQPDTWKQRAQEAEEVMLRLQRELDPDSDMTR